MYFTYTPLKLLFVSVDPRITGCFFMLFCFYLFIFCYFLYLLSGEVVEADRQIFNVDTPDLYRISSCFATIYNRGCSGCSSKLLCVSVDPRITLF